MGKILSIKTNLDVISVKNSKNIFRAVVLFLLSAAVLFAFSACGNEEPETTAPETTTKVTTTKAPEPEIIVNRLTGIDDLSEKAIGKRPVAVMINNLKGALPQYGVSDADLMFEMLVEGGITRMMAVYADYTKIPEVCSVRSCRYYFPIFAHGLDAVYFCFGSNETLGTPTLKRIGIDYIDGNQIIDKTVYDRDPERLGRYSSEHTAYLKGPNMPEILKKYDIRSDYLKEKDYPIFKFNAKGNTKGDTACDKVNFQYSNSYYTTFNYDKETKTYKKQHSGKDHIDQRSGKQLSYTNIFVLETEVTSYNGGPLVKIDWKGGSGYYISKGKSQKITWEKLSEDSTIKVFNKEGKELKVNPGKSYFGVISPGRTAITAAQAQ